MSAASVRWLSLEACAKHGNVASMDRWPPPDRDSVDGLNVIWSKNIIE